MLENTRYIFHVKDYVRYMLTGEAYAEYTDSTGGNLVNMNTKQYDKELLDCFGLGMCMDKLPPLKYSAEICGYVTEEASKKTGLPVGIPAAAGMFDVDACGIGSGLTDLDKLCMIAGTWSINEYIAKEPVTNGTVDLNSMFCMPGYFLVEESSPTSAGNMEWFIRNLMSYEKAEAKEKGGSVYDITNEWVESIDPKDSNVIFLPFLNGSNEDALAKATFIGLTAYHNKKHMLRAVYEGIGHAFFRSFDLSQPVGDIHQIHGEGIGQREVMMTLSDKDEASRLICGLTWGGEGAWTSWPPHQHEKDLEEVYCYFGMPLPHFGFHISYLKSGEVEDIVTHTVHSGTMVEAPVGYHPTVASPGTRNSYLWVLAAHSHSSRSYNLAVLDPALENFNSAR